MLNKKTQIGMQKARNLAKERYIVVQGPEGHAYERGLNGRQAAWAARKYKGHRVLPLEIMEELVGKNNIF
jgi:hypothetical protein